MPGGRSCCAGRTGAPRPRSGPSTRPAGDPDAEIASLGAAEPGQVAIDLAVVDARPADATATDSLLAVETRDGSAMSLAASLGRLPAYALIARRYRRLATR